MKIYVKKGATNYKEKKLIVEIENTLNKKSKTDSTILNSFKPATNWDELKDLHDKICGDFVEYEEVGEEETDIEKKHKEFKQGMAETMQPNDNPSVVDPFNDAEPIVRDYVLSEDFESKEQSDEPLKKSFDEPTSFEESFELPSEDSEKSTSKTQPKEKQSKDPKQPTEKVNPRFEDMSNAKKRRSTKKLAQMIVQGACILAEKGCIWWTTKDITEDKLVQYELENTMDLQILLTLDEGQQITVREWFGAKVVQANTLFKVSKEDKEDLIDSLFEVLLEKGIAPTPMQELMINAVKTFVLDMGLKAFAMRMEIKSVLNQLVTMKQNGGETQQSAPTSTTRMEDTITYEDIDDTIVDSPIVESGMQIINPISEISEVE
jgi:hypothetical protein